MARFRTFAILLLAASSLALAQRQMTVAQLEQFVRSSIDLKHPDKQVADIVKNLKLTERLDTRAVETLQGIGAGPRTLEALRALSAASVGMPMPAPPKPVVTAAGIPPPSEAQKKAILAEVTKNALEYTDGLPNFICTQLTKRHVDQGRGFRLMDTIQEQLSFVDKEEEYKVVLVNNLPVQNVGHRQLGGTTSRGEFGTMLYQIFKPETKAEITWDRWATLRGRRMHVFEFRVLQRNSEYSIADEASGRQMIAGYHGLVYADAETKQVMRIKMDLDGLEAFPIERVSLTLDYDFTDISGTKFVLPLRAELESRSGRYQSRNEVEFRRYERFSADATIIFDVPDEIPADQLQEQPLK